MANTDFKSVAQYLATKPKSSQAVLKKVRAIIREALPKEAQEVISYQIPAYKLHGAAVIYFSGWTKHFSIYPATGAMNEVLGDQLAPYKASKGTLKFSLTEPIPSKLIERVVKIRAKETLQRLAAKKKPAKK